MKRFIRGRLLLLSAAVALLVAGPASGQSYRSAIGLTVGGSAHGDLTPGLTATTRLEPGWIAGLQYEYWFADGRNGLRLNTLFTQRLLDDPVLHDYNVYVADVDLLVRLQEPDAYRRFAAFFVFGAGATHYAALPGTAPIGDGVYGENVVRAHLLASLGVDITATPTAGVRVEVGDKVVLPSIGYSPAFSGFPNVHNLVATVGFQLRMGSLAARRSMPVPPARPAPAPAPEPEAEAGPAAGEAAAAEREREIQALRDRVADLDGELAQLELRVGQLKERLEREREPAPTAAADTRTLYTVQVGSFLEPELAERLLEQVRSYGLPAWPWDATARGRTFTRVRAGAVTSEAEAQQLAALLQRQHGLPVWVDEIEEGEEMPAGAVSGTRQYLESGG